MSDSGGRAVLDRRKLVLGATGTLASAGLAKTLVWPSAAAARGGAVPPAPNPIGGGFTLPDGLA